MKNILSIKNVSYSYHTQEGETPALTDISFDVSSGSFTCICLLYTSDAADD